MERYRRAVDSGRLPIWIGKKLGREEQMARLMILGLKKGVVDIGLFYSRFGEHPETIYPKKIRKLKDLGLVVNTTDEHEKIDEFGYLALTPLGDLYSEEVARQFYTEETRKAIGDKGYAGFSLAELPKI
jgi:coproporphyrinogen III oxidase-like Fe-S oxidoreductase